MSRGCATGASPPGIGSERPSPLVDFVAQQALAAQRTQEAHRGRGLTAQEARRGWDAYSLEAGAVREVVRALGPGALPGRAPGSWAGVRMVSRDSALPAGAQMGASGGPVPDCSCYNTSASPLPGEVEEAYSDCSACTWFYDEGAEACICRRTCSTARGDCGCHFDFIPQSEVGHNYVAQWVCGLRGGYSAGLIWATWDEAVGMCAVHWPCNAGDPITYNNSCSEGLFHEQTLTAPPCEEWDEAGEADGRAGSTHTSTLLPLETYFLVCFLLYSRYQRIDDERSAWRADLRARLLDATRQHGKGSAEIHALRAEQRAGEARYVSEMAEILERMAAWECEWHDDESA